MWGSGQEISLESGARECHSKESHLRQDWKTRNQPQHKVPSGQRGDLVQSLHSRERLDKFEEHFLKQLL